MIDLPLVCRLVCRRHKIELINVNLRQLQCVDDMRRPKEKERPSDVVLCVSIAWRTCCSISCPRIHPTTFAVRPLGTFRLAELIG